MSTAAMTGPPDAAKAGHAKPQQPFKNGNAAGKALDGPRKQNGSPVDGQNRRSQQPQTKAWQGTNPITQRAAPSTTNGTEKPLPKLPPQAQNTGKQESGADRHLHDGLLFMMGSYMGHDATITLKNGERFAGVFSGGNFDSMTKSMYVLKMVRRTRSLGDAQVNGDADMSEEYLGEGEDHMMSFDAQDTLLFAVDGVIVADAPPTQNGQRICSSGALDRADALQTGSTTGSFRTDTEISSRQPATQQERQLQRWDDSADTEIDMSLDSGETGWDQFATNEKLYGVRTTYDENIYTTAIDRRDPRYKQREAEAARIAREIEGSSAANAHVAEERRRDAGKEDGRDEEEKYSGVRRESASLLPKRTAGAYVPPSHRPITGAPTVPGAPYDPAIIATSKPVPVPSQPTGTTPTIVEPVALPDRSKPTATDGKDMHVPVAASQSPRSQAESSTEDHISKTIDAFKQFANNEKLKVRQAQEQKRAGARQEKNVKLNDLKKFAANFKLNSRVPDDLVPILAKDREKQLEIQRKADEAAKEAELTPKEKKPKELKESREPTPGTTPPAPVSQTPVALVSDPRLQFNPNSRQRRHQQYYASNSAPHGPASFDPRMQHFGPNGSVQSSPRFPHAQMAAFNSQMPPHMQQIPVPFAGGGQLMQGGIPIGISPSLQPRQMVGGPGMPPGGPQAMMMQGGGYGGGGANGGGGQHHGRFRRGSKGQGNANGNWSGADERAGPSSVQQGPRGGGFLPGQQQFFAGGGGQQQQPHMGGAPMMAPSMSNGGGGGGVYMNGLPPQQQQGQGQGYSPMPHHAQMQHPGHGTPGPGGYAGSPRPALMAHSLSHQGFNPLQQQQQQHGGGGGMMQMGQQGVYGGGGGMSQQQQQQVFALGQGGAHPMHWQQRQMSSSGGGGYGGGVPAGVGMTPRPQQVAPMMQGQQQGQQGQQQHSGMPSPGPGSGGGSGVSGMGGPVGGSGHGQGGEEAKGG
ncbi:poly(A)-binding protein binding protein [Friedmanniomyces endolithicus]|uniref:Poly(A)-binding protein binding protein n=1 Tax=Rachicladosporium monterosium TaxID=1507873 RepID=A0ABR0L9H3_9PEZI|nr:poly(A)-binding protein binding protein [Friedmanniomyces endolithicus]KAK5145027.1 poly(A)-binding protein binding protein [Rachicladosporium monterosium]